MLKSTPIAFGAQSRTALHCTALPLHYTTLKTKAKAKTTTQPLARLLWCRPFERAWAVKNQKQRQRPNQRRRRWPMTAALR